MNKNTFFTIVIVGLLISNGIFVFFMTQKGPGKGPHKSPKEIVAIRLNFDEKQVVEYEALIKEHKQKTKDLIDIIESSRGALYGQLSETKNDETLDSLLQPIIRSQMSLEQLNFSHFQDIKSICKPEQIEKFEELTNDFAKIFGKRKPPPKR